MNILLFLVGCVYATALPFTRVNNEGVDLSIINGYNARRNQFPYIVSMQSNGQHGCGAAIISESWLLSAAHCFSSSQTYTAVAGLLVKGENRTEVQKIGVEKIIKHPDYNSPGAFSNDIALVQLKHPLKFSESVKPLRLPPKNKIPSGKATASGWGQIATNPAKSAVVLQYLEMKLLTNKVCQKFRKDNPLHVYASGRIAVDKLCVLPEETYQSVCYGDSGGPLVQNNVLIGIANAVYKTNCNQNVNVPYPNLYARVSHFIDFIEEHIKL